MATARKSSTSKKVSWEARYYIRKPDGRLAYKIKKGFSTKAEAQAYGVSHEHESSISSRTTMLQMFELMSQSNNANKTTTDTRRNRLIKYADTIINQPMNRVTKAVLQAWRSDLEVDDRIATTTKNDLIGFVKQIFVFAYNTYDFYDSAKVLKPFKKTLEDSHEMHIITPEDFNKMITFETNEIIRAILIFMFRTGCRKGEARALYKEDYDPVSKSVHIYKSMRRYESSLKTTKTASSVRRIPLDDKTIEIIKPLLKRHGKWLFGDTTTVCLSALQNHFKANLKAAELPDMRLHDLRHSHVSLLWANHVPVPEISKRIGHSSPAQTMQTYAHIFDNSQSATLAVLNRF